MLELGPPGRPGARFTRGTLRRLLGRMPERVPLDPENTERVDFAGGLVRHRVTYAVEPDERVAAYLFVPNRPRGPAVLCLHQHAGQFDLGKSEPAGLVGNPQQHYALHLAQRGFVTLVSDHLCFEERRDPRLDRAAPEGRPRFAGEPAPEGRPAFAGEQASPADRGATPADRGAAYERFEMTRRLTLGSTLQAKLTWDAMRALDLLCARPEVNPHRIGCIGHSLGGQQTLFLAALDRRVAAAVSSCGFSTLATIFRDGINHNLAAYVPGLGLHGDCGDVLSLVAPRPFLVVAGRSDRIFPIDGLEAAIARARQAYAHSAERLAYQTDPGGHAFTDDFRAAAYAWLERWLGPQRYSSQE